MVAKSRHTVEAEHGIPRRGYALSSAVEAVAQHARVISASLHEALKGGLVDSTTTEERAAWLALSAWIIATKSGGLPLTASLGDAQSWFYGRQLTVHEAEFWQAQTRSLAEPLAAIIAAPGVKELFPYILETHGPGSRLSVRKDPSTQASRQRKKAGGVFYTPPDVANFMVSTSLGGSKFRPKTILDPAVGTGVFLRATLAGLLAQGAGDSPLELATKSLFGCDVDELALDGAASVLLLDTIADVHSKELIPHTAWTALRANMKCCDATLIDPSEGSGTSRKALGQVFSQAIIGFDLIIGNPPYAKVGPRSDFGELGSKFFCMGRKPRPTADLYPLFIEQMMRLSRPGTRGALVVPLSLACSEDSQISASREFIQKTPGEWKFAFFDRQPHALFGEDVKTRNAVIFWENDGSEFVLRTGPLRRWRGDYRAKMFSSIGYTHIASDIRQGIPKLNGSLQAEAWARLNAERIRCSALIASTGRTTLATVPNGEPTHVYVAPTAYNFIGTMRPGELTTALGELLSTNPLHRLICVADQQASALYAVLSSNLAFWWWHVKGDGFHVNSGTLLDIPLGPGAKSPDTIQKLASLGDSLWHEARKLSTKSLNRGRVSYTFPPTVAPDIQEEIDDILISSLSLPRNFSRELRDFSHTVRTAGLFETQEKKTREVNSMNKISVEAKEKSIVTKEEWREYTKTVWSIANKSRDDHPAVFPTEIPHRLIKLFSFYGESVLDPFAGSGTTARAAIPLGRRAICVDQNPEYVEIIKRECSTLHNGHGEDFEPLQVVHGDSRNLEFLEDNSVGLAVTSPPYWDKADYGSGASNLGNIPNYTEFLSGLRPVFEECFRVLAPGRKMCVVTANVNQHTDQGLLTFPLATDFAVLLREIGFVMVNEIIWSKDGTGGKWGSFGSQRPIFGSYPYPPNFLFKNVHEYILIFAKPALTKTKGRTVKSYSALMSQNSPAQTVQQLQTEAGDSETSGVQ